MEESRLTPMREGYDPLVFNEIYESVKGLKYKLASGISHDRFGVERADIISWFNIKFIFVFNKYYGTMSNDTLKGFIINSLKQYKNRILRVSYQDKYANNPIDIADLFEYRELIIEENSNDSYEFFLELASSYMAKHLSNDAFEVFQIELYPPPFILKRLLKLNPDSPRLNKIPPQLIADYLNLGTSQKAIDYIQNLRQEIKGAIEKAREFFKQERFEKELV